MKKKKILTERRLCALAGIKIVEADTLDLYATRKAAKKRGRHSAEKEFFGSDKDPLVTTDVPDSRLASPPAADPAATQPLSADQLLQIQKDVPDENRRPIAMELYKELIAPFYSERQLKHIVDVADLGSERNRDRADALGQLIGWFHPAFEDARGRATYDNPSRLGIQVAQEFKDEDLDIVDDAGEFVRRLEKYLYDETKSEFAKAMAHREAQPRHPDFDRPPSRMQTPGTPEHAAFQRMMQQAGDVSDRGPGQTLGRVKK